MGSLDNDPVLGADAYPLRLLRRPVRQEDDTASRRGALHPRLGAGHRSQLCRSSLRGPHVLRPGLRHRLHSGSHVHRRDRHESSSRGSLNTHHVNEQSKYLH